METRFWTTEAIDEAECEESFDVGVEERREEERELRSNESTRWRRVSSFGGSLSNCFSKLDISRLKVSSSARVIRPLESSDMLYQNGQDSLMSGGGQTLATAVSGYCHYHFVI